MGKAKGEAARTKSRPSSSRFLDIFFFFVLLLLFLINSVWGSNQCHARIIEKEKRKTIAAWLLHYCHRVLRPWVSVALLEVHLWTLRSLQPLMPLLLRSVLNNFIYLFIVRKLLCWGEVISFMKFELVKMFLFWVVAVAGYRWWSGAAFEAAFA